MANLPTAYASQSFGRKTLDFYAVEGEIAGADPRARAEERRLQDIDGARHTMRLMEGGFELSPGQTATVLRMQPGPAQRSRPVAVVNHDTGGWCRTHPGAEGLLAKAGVSRTLNWALTMGVFALAALAVIWPFLRAFLVEVDPSLFSQAPAVNIAGLAATALPALTSWSFSDAIAPLTRPLGEIAPGLAPFADALVFGSGVLFAALGVYLLRSWRLLWAPLFIGALGAASFGFGGAAGVTGPALSGLGLAAGLFVIGGLINRIRDGARLEARIAVLADHLLRQGPQDAVAPTETESEAETEIEEDPDAEGESDPGTATEEALKTLAPAATAASLRQPGEVLETEAEPAETAEIVDAAPSEDPGTDLEAAENNATGSEPEAGDLAPESGEVSEVSANSVEIAADIESDAEHDQVEVPAADAASEDLPEHPQPESAAETAEIDDSEPRAEASTPELRDADADLDDETNALDADLEPDPDEVGSQNEANMAAALEKGEAELSRDTTPAGLDADEAERLRTDPRYASRAIVLPPPPPMPDPAKALGAGSGEATGARETQTLKPDAPLRDNVIPIFAAPASAPNPSTEEVEEEDDKDKPETD